MTSVTHIVLGSLRLTVDTAFHWAVIFIALCGFLVSCCLIYRRFRDEEKTSLKTKNSSELGKCIHLTLLVSGNIIAFISILLFLLPFEREIPSSSYDVLLTSGFKKPAADKDFNIEGADNPKIIQILKSAERIWLLTESLQTTDDNQALKIWLAENYQDKVVVINSIEELTDVWSMSKLNHYNANLSIPTLLQVFGDGLSKAQWQRLNNINHKLSENTQTNKHNRSVTAALNTSITEKKAEKSAAKFTFYKSKPLTGLSYLHWPKQLILGQTLTVTGRLQHPLDKKTQFELSLVSNDRIQERVIVQNNDAFSLSTTTKISGLFNYQLILKQLPSSNEDTNNLIKISEDITFSVVNGNQPKVLIKQSSPSFETRRIKQWLSEAGSEVAIISQISKSKWSQQSVNAPEVKGSLNTTELTKSLLDGYDLLIMDSRMLLALKANEIDALYNAIKAGLGLLVNADATLLTNENAGIEKINKLLHFFKLALIETPSKQVTANWPEKPRLTKSEIITPQAITIHINTKQGQTLVESDNGQALVAKQSLGLGVVALTTLNETYQWSSQINSAYYSAYWQYLLLNISRAEKDTRWLVASPEHVASVDKFHNICLLSSLENIYVPDMKVTNYPLTKYKQCGVFLAFDKGWHTFKVLNDKQEILAEQTRYYYSQTDFPAWQQAIKHKVSQYQSESKYLENLTLLENKVVDSSVVYQPINKFILWLIMFIALVGLWIERKWHSN